VPGLVTEVDLTADHVNHTSINLGGNMLAKGEAK
jgi:hypothetical protein